MVRSYLITYVIIIARGSDRPTVIEFNHHVRDEVAINWYELGINLMIPNQQLSIIRKNYSQNVQMCCTKMFESWLQVDPTANWNKLIEALEKINHITLAEEVRSSILQGT